MSFSGAMRVGTAAIGGWLLVAAAGCGDDRARIGEAPSGSISPAATAAMARAAIAEAGEGFAPGSALWPSQGGHVMERMLASVAERSMPWWWTPLEGGIQAELMPTLSIAALTGPDLASRGVAREGSSGWAVGYEGRMWWRALPESWSARAGETVLERPERAIGLAVTRPLGEKLEASFGYHRTMPGDFDAELDPAGSEQSLFLKLGWSF